MFEKKVKMNPLLNIPLRNLSKRVKRYEEEILINEQPEEVDCD